MLHGHQARLILSPDVRFVEVRTVNVAGGHDMKFLRIQAPDGGECEEQERQNSFIHGVIVDRFRNGNACVACSCGIRHADSQD